MNCTLVRNLCVIHHSWWNNPLVVFGLHEYRPIYRFEASAVKAMRPILTRVFSFQLILGFCTLHRSQHWKYNIAICRSRFFTVTSVMVSKYTYLKMRVSKECFLHVCRPGIVVLILSSRRILSLSVIQFCSRMYWHGIAASAAAAAAAFRGGLARCTLEDSSSFQRCSNLVNHTRDFPRHAVKVRNTDYRSFLPFRAMMNRNS